MYNHYFNGRENAAAGRAVYDRPYANRPLTKLDRAEMAAGFEDERIARGIGTYPVELIDMRRPNSNLRFYLVGPNTYNTDPSTTAGYKSLTALAQLKNFPLR